MLKANKSPHINSDDEMNENKINKQCGLINVIGNSETMKQVADMVIRVAKSDANVLIYGESGTGKELIARNIHLYSRRHNHPFIPLDCVALPSTLLESEIFGFERGAFTGAVKSKPGIFELANKGILFLDEIVDLNMNLQAKLLRVLQEYQFRRLGGTKLTDVDVRIISATNQNPEEAVEKRKLREDLYFRLNVVPIFLPPLRERKEDISLLAHYFIEKFNPSCFKKIEGITDEAISYLENYHWPGNIRELQNVIEQTMSLTKNVVIYMEDLPRKIREWYRYSKELSINKLSFQKAKQKCLHYFYKQYFTPLLKKHHGNISKVAEEAGISRKTIYKILKIVKE